MDMIKVFETSKINTNTMTDTEEVLLKIYKVLIELRYPDITKAEPNNVEVTILTGESRISLLTWLLAKKSLYIATALENLTGTALEDEVFKYYSEIGICTDKNILLGKCPLKEQLPTLRLLIEFIKNVHMKSLPTICKNGESIDDVVKAYLKEDANILSLCNVKPKMNRTEVIQYFEDLKNERENEARANLGTKLSENIPGNLETTTVEKKTKEYNSNDLDAAFHREKENFTEAFAGINAWTAPNPNRAKYHAHSMDKDIKNVYSDFAKLTEILKIQNEISEINIPNGSNRTCSPLNGIVEETVIFVEKFQNMYRDD